MIRHARLAILYLAVGCAARATTTASMRAAPAPTLEVARDSTRALLGRIQEAVRHRDVTAVMATYPDTGDLVSAAFGYLQTDRALFAKQLGTMFESVEAVTFDFTRTIIEPISPTAAAVTAEYRMGLQVPPMTAPAGQCGVWSAVVAQRGGRFVILQEHQSARPQIC